MRSQYTKWESMEPCDVWRLILRISLLECGRLMKAAGATCGEVCPNDFDMHHAAAMPMKKAGAEAMHQDANVTASASMSPFIG
jgi:hypothetical protein